MLYWLNYTVWSLRYYIYILIDLEKPGNNLYKDDPLGYTLSILVFIQIKHKEQNYWESLRWVVQKKQK